MGPLTPALPESPLGEYASGVWQKKTSTDRSSFEANRSLTSQDREMLLKSKAQASFAGYLRGVCLLQLTNVANPLDLNVETKKSPA